MKKNLPLLSVIIIASLLLGACGAGSESAIATSVALTVQAQSARATATPRPTSTPANSTVIPTLTNIVTPPSPTTQAGSTSYSECTKASLVSETVPDGTIVKPETTFYKSWTIKNESTCTWTTSYKIVFWDGNTLGGAYVYNLPLVTGPGETIEIPIQLVAPKEEGNYRGEWKLQTPDGINFGVGQYNEAFYVDVVVKANPDDEEYKITSVTYRLVRDPAAGCATNVFYYVYVTITTNGPIDVRVQWFHSDGYTSSKIHLIYDEAGTYELEPQKGQGGWSFHLGDSPGDKWMQLIQVDPVRVEFNKVTFSYLCQ